MQLEYGSQHQVKIFSGIERQWFSSQSVNLRENESVIGGFGSFMHPSLVCHFWRVLEEVTQVIVVGILLGHEVVGALSESERQNDETSQLDKKKCRQEKTFIIDTVHSERVRDI